MSTIASDYQMLRTAAAFRTSDECVLLLRGKDVLDFLHRLSTNDVLAIAPGHTASTILTTEKGRIIDLVQILNTGSDIYIVGPAGHAPALIGWLTKYIIVEEIEVDDVTTHFQRANLIGPNAFSSIISHFAIDPPSGSGDLATVSQAHGSTYIYRTPLWNLPSLTLLSQTSFPLDFPTISEAAFQLVRIEEGIPESGKDLTSAVNPLEAGLQGLVCATKGCYIGQEVIARIDTYKKLQRKLTGIIIDTDSDEAIQPGLLYSSTEQIGFTTSHAYSPRLRKQIALGYVKIGAHSPLQFAPAGDSRRINALLMDLPFPT